MKQRATLPLSELAAGMRVAAPVTDAGGHVLLPEGASISDAILGSLARHEVAEVCVEFEVAEDSEQMHDDKSDFDFKFVTYKRNA